MNVAIIKFAMIKCNSRFLPFLNFRTFQRHSSGIKLSGYVEAGTLSSQLRGSVLEPFVEEGVIIWTSCLRLPKS